IVCPLQSRKGIHPTCCPRGGPDSLAATPGVSLSARSYCSVRAPANTSLRRRGAARRRIFQPCHPFHFYCSSSSISNPKKTGSSFRSVLVSLTTTTQRRLPCASWLGWKDTRPVLRSILHPGLRAPLFEVKRASRISRNSFPPSLLP